MRRTRPLILALCLALLAACAAPPPGDASNATDARPRMVIPGLGWGGAGM